MAKNHNTILIVDDDPDVSAVLTDYFDKVGFNVFHASNGEMGFKLAQSLHPQVILCDELMPIMSGHEMLAKIMATNMTCQIPVVIISGQSGDEEAAWQSRGAIAFVPKPFLLSDLLVVVQRVLDRASVTAQLPFSRGTVVEQNPRMKSE